MTKRNIRGKSQVSDFHFLSLHSSLSLSSNLCSKQKWNEYFKLWWCELFTFRIIYTSSLCSVFWVKYSRQYLKKVYSNFCFQSDGRIFYLWRSLLIQTTATADIITHLSASGGEHRSGSLQQVPTHRELMDFVQLSLSLLCSRRAQKYFAEYSRWMGG